jgi:hypothetical protein
MIGYFFYFLLAVGLSILLTASFRRLRGDGTGEVPPEEDAAFDRRMAEIEKRFGNTGRSNGIGQIDAGDKETGAPD